MKQLLGEIIRQKIREDGRTAKVICAELGMSRGNLDKIYHKDSVNTDLLARFSEVLRYDFFVHVNPFRKEELKRSAMPGRFNVVEDESAIDAAQEKLRVVYEKLERQEQEVEFLRNSLQDLKSHLADKDEIIALQKDKISYQDKEIQSSNAELERLRELN